MFIYIFKSDLFKGQNRKIVSNYPLDIKKLFDLVNSDNDYPAIKKWFLVEEY